MTLKAVMLSVAVAASAVPMATMAADPAPAQKSETAKYVNDAALTAKVKAALVAEKNLSSMDINVETQAGVVQLSGFVASSAQIEQAANVAERVKGVKEVKNDLRLKTDAES